MYQTSDGDYESEKERMRRLAAKNIIEESGFQKRHLTPFTPSGDAWIAARDKVAKLIGTGFIVALCGPRGTGKTQLSQSVAMIAAKQGKWSMYSTAMGFFLAIKESFDGKKSEREVIETFAKRRLLVLDEMQERGETPWEDRLLTHLIDKRYGDMKDTILITNQTKEAFLASIGPSVASRITESGGVITCDWPSYR